MRSALVWSFACAALFLLILALPRQPWPAAGWAFGGAYFLFGVVLLGTVSRWWRRGSAPLWRPAMLSLGSLAAAIEIWLHPEASRTVPLVDQWMVALLGLLAAAVLARLMPDRFGRLWFRIERRSHDRNPGRV